MKVKQRFVTPKHLSTPTPNPSPPHYTTQLCPLPFVQTKKDDIVRAYAEAVAIWQALADRPDRSV